MSCIMILGEFSWVNLKKHDVGNLQSQLFHACIPTLFLVVCLFVLEKSLINQFQQVKSEIVPGKCHQVSFCKLPPGNLTWSLNMTHLGRGFTQKNHGDGLHGYRTQIISECKWLCAIVTGDISNFFPLRYFKLQDPRSLRASVEVLFRSPTFKQDRGGGSQTFWKSRVLFVWKWQLLVWHWVTYTIAQYCTWELAQRCRCPSR